MHVQGAPENEHTVCNDHNGALDNESRVHIIGSINNNGLGRPEEMVNPNPSIAMRSNDELGLAEETVNTNPVAPTGASDEAVMILVHAQADGVSADVNMITNANANASVVGNANTNNASVESDDAMILDRGSCPEIAIEMGQNVVCEFENVAKRACREQEIKEKKLSPNIF
jgi:hypothetical protein